MDFARPWMFCCDQENDPGQDPAGTERGEDLDEHLDELLRRAHDQIYRRDRTIRYLREQLALAAAAQRAKCAELKALREALSNSPMMTVA